MVFFIFFRRQISAGGVQSFRVVPGNPVHSSERDIPDTMPWLFPLDNLLLIQAVQRLRRRVIVGISLSPDRTDCADLAEPLGVADRGILHPAVGMVDKLAVH